MIDRLRPVLQDDARVACALLFGSYARGQAHAQSDVDVAIGPAAGRRFNSSRCRNVLRWRRTG